MPIELQTNIALKTTPDAPDHLVNVSWVEQFFTGKVKAPVRLVSTVDIPGTYTVATHTLEVTATGPTDIDGIAVNVGDRVLLVGQTAGEENGIYVVIAVGAATTHTELDRSADFNDASQIFEGVTIAVNQGDTQSGTTWKLVTGGPITLGSTPLDFISVTPATGTAAFSETITGDGIDTEFDVVHNLGTSDVSTTIRNLATQGMVLADVRVVDNNTVEVGFAEPPPASAGPYRVTVIG